MTTTQLFVLLLVVFYTPKTWVVAASANYGSGMEGRCCLEIYIGLPDVKLSCQA